MKHLWFQKKAVMKSNPQSNAKMTWFASVCMTEKRTTCTECSAEMDLGVSVPLQSSLGERV